MRLNIVIPKTDEYIDLKDTGADEPETPSAFVVLIQREAYPVDLLGPYGSRQDAESEVRDLLLTGQEGTVVILPVFPGWVTGPALVEQGGSYEAEDPGVAGGLLGH